MASLFGFNITRNNTPVTSLNDATEKKEGYSAFSTPFLNVGNGNLALPSINTNYLGVGGYVRFGNDNLYPQLINQMKYTSPLNGSILKFKLNSVIGGGYTIETLSDNGIEKVKVYTFEKKNKINKLYKKLSGDWINHERMSVLLHFDSKMELQRIERLDPATVRRNESGTLFSVCKDWYSQIGIIQYKAYHPTCRDKVQLLEYTEDDDNIYPIPTYCSAFNWCQLDGESSYLQKQNIRNSIYPSFALLLPQMPGSDEEKNAITTAVDRAKGASEAGKVMILAAPNKDKLPDIKAIPTNQNDKLFESTDRRIDDKICQAHTIAPILMGIQTPGKLGAGQDIKTSYQIFEKNMVMPTRNTIEEFINELFFIGGVQATFKFNNFQIIGGEITEVTETKI